MNRSIILCAAMGVFLSLGIVKTSDAWLIDTTANVNTNSHNDSSTNIGDRSSYMRNTYNQRYDNRQDRSEHINDSFNSQDSHNVYDSANKANNSVNGSFNKELAAGGDVRNSVLGDFNQFYSGTDFRSGVTGSGNTIDTSSVNVTTLGDTLK